MDYTTSTILLCGLAKILPVVGRAHAYTQAGFVPPSTEQLSKQICTTVYRACRVTLVCTEERERVCVWCR